MSIVLYTAVLMLSRYSFVGLPNLLLGGGLELAELPLHTSKFRPICSIQELALVKHSFNGMDRTSDSFVGQGPSLDSLAESP